MSAMSLGGGDRDATREGAEAAGAAERSRVAREALEQHLAEQDFDDDGLGCARAIVRCSLGTLVVIAVIVALVRWL